LTTPTFGGKPRADLTPNPQRPGVFYDQRGETYIDDATWAKYETSPNGAPAATPQPGAPTPHARQLDVIAGNGVQPRAVSWLWDLRVPIGGLSVVAGVPGLGKSQLIVRLAADASRGALDGGMAGIPRNVLIASLEDTLDTVLVPRLIAADADLSRIFFVRCKAEHGGALDLGQHLREIETIALQKKVAAVAIDPLVAALGNGKIDAHKDQQVRAVLAPTAAMAERLQVAVIGVMHFNKSAVDALLGVGGSVGFVGAARSVLVFTRKPDDEAGARSDERVLAHSKSNWGPEQPSRLARITTFVIPASADTANKDIDTSYVALGEVVDLDPNDLMPAPGHAGRPPREREDVKRRIVALLGAVEPLTRPKIAAALERDKKDHTVRRAVAELVADGTLTENNHRYSLSGEGVQELFAEGVSHPYPSDSDTPLDPAENPLIEGSPASSERGVSELRDTGTPHCAVFDFDEDDAP